MMAHIPSSYLFTPKHGKLTPYRHGRIEELADRSKQVEGEIKKLLTQKNYPCTPALRSFNRGEYQVGLYKGFGKGLKCADLRQDLLYYIQKQRETMSPYLTFWAVYDDPKKMTEDDFEINLWNELSFLTSEDMRGIDWPENKNSNPDDKDFSFCLGGEAFFVVGLHPQSSRIARQFKWPTLIFNLFSQFELLKIQGSFFPAVRNSRARDTKLQGSPNPMAVKHGEVWESIQFSGKENPSSWKCPFRFLKK
jgi:FPC/CPF motif-containing protein YcgG